MAYPNLAKFLRQRVTVYFFRQQSGHAQQDDGDEHSDQERDRKVDGVTFRAGQVLQSRSVDCHTSNMVMF